MIGDPGPYVSLNGSDVVDGVATLPDGRTVAVAGASVCRVPVVHDLPAPPPLDDDECEDWD